MEEGKGVSVLPGGPSIRIFNRGILPNHHQPFPFPQEFDIGRMRQILEPFQTIYYCRLASERDNINQLHPKWKSLSYLLGFFIPPPRRILKAWASQSTPNKFYCFLYYASPISLWPSITLLKAIFLNKLVFQLAAMCWDFLLWDGDANLGTKWTCLILWA